MATPKIAGALACTVLCAATHCLAQQSQAEKWIDAGHWKRARADVEARIRQAPDDALANFLLSQIRAAFGDRTTPLRLAEKAVALDGHTAKYHRQVAEVLGVAAQHSNAFQQLFLARRFRGEIDAALALDPRDVQAHRDLLEFYLLAPGIAGGSPRKARSIAERIAAIDPTAGLLAQARMATFNNQTTQAESLLQKAAEAQPPSYRAKIAEAGFYLSPEHPNLAAAETTARQATKLDPGRTDAYAILASIYADRGRWSELDAILAESIREAPDDLYPYYRAAERLIASAQNLDRAESYLRAYLGQEPEGNRPTVADATSLLNRISAARLRRMETATR